jgi:hypothetical protein
MNIHIKNKEYEELEGISGKIGIFKLKNMGCVSIFIKKGKTEIKIKKAGGEIVIKNILPVKIYAKSRCSILMRG